VQINGFISHYETLEVPPSASLEAIERRFRSLARRYHPDNQSTGDRAKFDALVEAHETLKDAGKRAQYHEEHKHSLPPLPQSAADEAATETGAEPGEGETFDGMGVERDISIQNHILAFLYQKRRRNIREPGVGTVELERVSGCPHDFLEFHVWYLKEKGWIATGEDGLLAITIDGVDRAASIYRESANRLITDQS
jgi:curved DNA-binding protein CbpA